MMLVIQNTLSHSSFIIFCLQFQSVINRNIVRNSVTLTSSLIANYQKTDRFHGIDAGEVFQVYIELLS